MIRDVKLFDDLIEGEEAGEWPVMTLESAPFTGLSVDLYPEGQIWTVVENNDGYQEGYGVTYDRDGVIVDVDEYYSHRRNGLVAEWNAAGTLQNASRFEEDIRTSEWRAVGDKWEQVEIDGTAEPIAEKRSYLKRIPPPIPTSIEDLLARFDGKGEALYREAQRGLRVK